MWKWNAGVEQHFLFAYTLFVCFQLYYLFLINIEERHCKICLKNHTRVNSLVLAAKHKINVGQSTHIFTEVYYWQTPIKNACSSGSTLLLSNS